MSGRNLDGYVCPFADRSPGPNLFWPDWQYLAPGFEPTRARKLEEFFEDPEKDNLIIPLPPIGGRSAKEYAETVGQAAVDAIAFLPRQSNPMRLVGRDAFTVFQAPFYEGKNRFRVSPSPRIVTTKESAFARITDAEAANFRAKIEKEIGLEKKRLGLDVTPSVWPVE